MRLHTTIASVLVAPLAVACASLVGIPDRQDVGDAGDAGGDAASDVQTADAAEGSVAPEVDAPADDGAETGVDAGPVAITISPALIHLAQSNTAKLDVNVDRGAYTGDVTVSFGGLPNGVTPTWTIVPAHTSAVSVTLTATPTATLGPAQIVASATGTSSTSAATVLVQGVSGALDTTFGNGGIARVTFAQGIENIATQQGLVVTAGGQIVVCGDVGNDPNSDSIGIARLTQDGAPDPAFNQTGTVAWKANSEAIPAGCAVEAASGRVLVGGYQILSSEPYHSMLAAAFTSAGALDQQHYGTLGAFTNDVGADAKIDAIATGSDGSMLALGFAGPTSEVFRLTPAGTLDTGFAKASGGLLLFPSKVYGQSVGLLSDGRFMTWVADATSLWWLQRYSADGVADTNYGVGGGMSAKLPLASSYAVVAPDDSVVVAGLATGDAGTTGGIELAHFLTDGSLDAHFGTQGTTTTTFALGSAQIVSVAVGPDGRIATAFSLSTASATSFSAATFDATGALDTSFGTNGLASADVGGNPLAQDVAFDAYGRILVAGRAAIPGASTNEMVVARFWP